ncbi:hypothetical protein, partial [Escherichia coli]|uniref:hypothetical protein n=1 Tax=Escherichia coli TaxID=562 RepID=UPI0038D39F4A
VPAYGPQNDVTLKMPAFEWVHVQLHQQKGMISLSPPTICNSADESQFNLLKAKKTPQQRGFSTRRELKPAAELQRL